MGPQGIPCPGRMVTRSLTLLVGWGCARVLLASLPPSEMTKLLLLAPWNPNRLHLTFFRFPPTLLSRRVFCFASTVSTLACHEAKSSSPSQVLQQFHDHDGCAGAATLLTQGQKPSKQHQQALPLHSLVLAFCFPTDSHPTRCCSAGVRKGRYCGRWRLIYCLVASPFAHEQCARAAPTKYVQIGKERRG